MMEEKLPGYGIKACPHITSRIKTLKRLWQAAYDMVYETNTSGFGWDPDTKCVTAEKEVWDEYIKAHLRAAQFRTKSFPNFDSLSMVWGRDRDVGEDRVKMTLDQLKELGITMEDVSNYRKHMSTIWQCRRDGGSKYMSKDIYDEYEEDAKWKRDNEAKEAKKRKCLAKNNADTGVFKKRKAPSEVDGESLSESSSKHKKKKAEQKKHGKSKVVVSDSSGGDDKGWKPTELDNGSSDTNN
ncbi:hypothetical protein K1719_002164 [Acacia pycnantha]|nr:hypothetical protein K1719_002164 [Acacia pycnantha]